MKFSLLVYVPVVALTACGAVTSYEPVIEDNVSFTVTDTTLSFVSSDGTTTTLARSEDYDYGSFVGALQTTGDTQGMIAVYTSEDASAGIGVRYDGDNIAYLTSYQRLTEVDRPIVGSATYSGEFVSAFVEQGVFESSAPSQVRGDLTMAVNFGGQTVEGEISNRTAYLLGVPFEFELNDAAGNIALQQTALGDDGQFRGVAVYSDAEAGTAAGTYGGLIAGEGGSEVVGAVRIGDEAGVFAATEN